MKKQKIIQSMLAKSIAFFLTVIGFFLAGACAFGAYFMVEEEVYTRDKDQLKKELFSGNARNDGRILLYDFLYSDEEAADENCKGTNITYEIFDKNGNRLGGNHSGDSVGYEFENVYEYTNVGDSTLFGKNQVYTVKVYIDKQFPVTDNYSSLSGLVEIVYSLRFAVYLIGVLAVLVCIASFHFLMCSAGHRAQQEGAQARGLEKLPMDALTAALLLGSSITVVGVYENGIYGYGDMIMQCVGILASFLIFIRYCMIAAVQVKTGILWKNTLICRLLKTIARIGAVVCRAIVIFFRGLPLIWNTVLLIAGITMLELIFFFIAQGQGEPWAVVTLWIVEKLIFIPAVLYLALVLRGLQKGARELAEGHLDFQVDTHGMFWDFKEHGENLNSMAQGMNLALEERMRSEHLKTELITNVSHDIKTPLTSIINYTELIGEEPTENDKIREYTQVLQRQSARLKKLIEDLVEASKASTGNIEVHLVPCEVGVLLTQTVGEYEQRLEENGLQLITRQPETPVRIMADGKLLWRVFDNLLNNICKYAQNGTRVYLSVEETDDKALIAFKNTSRYPLDVSAQELMERFVRGDSSRHTEGNGLGLSIAQSLTQLQNGSLVLTVDGDFFKVVLEFDSMENPPYI